MNNSTYTITFGDQGENHIGMQKVGSLAPEGFNLKDLLYAQDQFKKKGISSELIDLSTYLNGTGYKYEGEAYILIVRNGLNAILDTYNSSDFFTEQKDLEKDTKALMKGKVVNKKARYNLCFSTEPQEPNYEEGKGRIVSFKSVPLLQKVRSYLPDIIGIKGKDLIAEGNYYYDINSCYIGFHGDTERRKVIGIRTGISFPLHYQWFLQSLPIGPNIEFILNDADIYIMSEKAVGSDWKRKKILTLRHAAGLRKNIPTKKLPIPVTPSISGVKSISEMTYRELQAECKKKGLKAVGKTEELRSRLLGST